MLEMQHVYVLLIFSCCVAVTHAGGSCSIVNRVDCSSGVGGKDSGQVALTPQQCQKRGCCYANDMQGPACFFAAEGSKTHTIHMINSNHFDAGNSESHRAVPPVWVTLILSRLRRPHG